MQAIVAGLVIVGLTCVSLAPVSAQEEKPGDVESRGMPQLQRPLLQGSPTQPNAPGQSNTQLPTYPQKFEVQGPEADSFVFAVTQPGSVVVDIQSQGAPVIVTLQGPAPQPMSQQGAGPLRLAFTVTPQDVQKGVLWGLQIRLAQPAPPQQGGRAGGLVNLQAGPMDTSPGVEYEYDLVGSAVGERKALDSAFVVHYDVPVEGHRDWRQRNLTVVGGGESVCVIAHAPRAVWKKSKPARNLLTSVVGSIRF